MSSNQGLDALVAAIEQVLRDQDTDLDRLRTTGALIDLLHAFQRDAVRTARADGATWEQVGSALGLSRQAVHQRFAKKPTL